MRRVLCLSMLAMVGFASAPVSKPRPDPAAVDLALLQGEWVYTLQRLGDEPPTSGEGVRVVIEKAVFQTSQGDRYQITLEVSKKKPLVTLYQITGDKLIYCVANELGVTPESIIGGPGMEVHTLERLSKP